MEAEAGSGPEKPRSRLWVFCLLGPVIGEALLLFFIDPGSVSLTVLMAAVVPTYWLGLLPALFVGIVDGSLEERGKGAWSRLLAAALAGAAAPLVLLLPLYARGLIHGPYPLILCLAASASGFLCVCIALGMRKHRK